MKKILLMMVLLVMVGSVSAVIVPRNTYVIVDFQGERSFRLLAPGFERLYSWDNFTTRADDSINYTLYDDINLSNYAGQIDVSTYQAIIPKITNMYDVCAEVVKEVNKSSALKDERDTAKTNEALAIRDRDIYMEKYLDYRNRTKAAEDKFTECDSGYNSCRVDRATAQNTANKYDTCNTDLTKAKNDQILWGLGGAAIVLILTAILKKKRNMPSEQADASYSGDQVDEAYYEQPPE